MNTSLQIGTRLCTRDGRRSGNAIITAISESEHGIGTLYSIETDFGNTARLTSGEINEFFHPPTDNKPDLQQWRLDRLTKRAENELQ